MALLAALVPNTHHLARLRAAVRDRYTVLPCEDFGAVRSTCTEEPVSVAVVDLLATGVERFEPLRQLRSRFPSLTIVLYTAVPPASPRDIFEAGRFGVDALILVDADDEPRRMLSLIEQAEARGVIGHVREALEGVRPVVRDAVLVSVTRAHQRLTPDRLAKVLGIGRKALRARLTQAGYPSPARLIAWGRLIVAARLLEDQGRSVEAVALSLDYASGSAFRNICQRYLHATPQHIRADSATKFVIAAFLREVGGQRHAEPE